MPQEEIQEDIVATDKYSSEYEEINESLPSKAGKTSSGAIEESIQESIVMASASKPHTSQTIEEENISEESGL